MLKPDDIIRVDQTGELLQFLGNDKSGNMRFRWRRHHNDPWSTDVTYEEGSSVHKPDHYQNGLGIQVIDIINEYFADNYNLGNVLKYLLRADKKGNRQQDLEKALTYLTWEVERGR